ncbi:MAG: hypothetical protein VKL39_07455 [Leptolyngbyaceae bacterium]|nr:hypothetical protein [Leptolyngbyaceae bacterium]
MLKRVLKPGDTHLMSADEEYCRIIHERQWNAPDIFNLSIELYDKGGMRIRRTFQKVAAENEETILQETIGGGWEIIFRQDYTDWSVCCQKRPRTTSSNIRYLVSQSVTSDNGWLRNVLVGVVGVGVVAVVAALTVGRRPELLTADTTPSSDNEQVDDATPTDDELALPEEDSIDTENSASDNSSDNSDAVSGTLEEDALDGDRPDADAPQTIGDALFDDDGLGEDVTPRSDASDDIDSEADSSSDEKPEGDDVVAVAIATDSTSQNPGNPGSDPFVAAVRMAQAAVIEGQVADTRSDWLELADQWQEAADLMAAVSRDDDRYDIAQDRVEVYENNRDIARSEAEKAGSN